MDNTASAKLNLNAKNSEKNMDARNQVSGRLPIVTKKNIHNQAQIVIDGGRLEQQRNAPAGQAHASQACSSRSTLHAGGLQFSGNKDRKMNESCDTIQISKPSSIIKRLTREELGIFPRTLKHRLLAFQTIHIDDKNNQQQQKKTENTVNGRESAAKGDSEKRALVQESVVADVKCPPSSPLSRVSSCGTGNTFSTDHDFRGVKEQETSDLSYGHYMDDEDGDAILVF
jgi:hypothetical protein